MAAGTMKPGAATGGMIAPDALSPDASVPPDHLVAMVGPTVQRYLTGPLVPRP